MAPVPGSRGVDAHAPTQLGGEQAPLDPTGVVCEAGRVYAGQYLVRGLLGAGGMGEVYLVEHQTLKAPFALKVLRPTYRIRPDIVTRFQAESRALWELSHPNFVQVHHAGEDPAIGPYIVMEVLEGKALNQLVAELAPIALEYALPIAIAIADAAQVMHQVGIIHRDLKPENLFMQTDEVSGWRVKLLDLGAAKIEKYGAQPTADNKAIGTGRYMSPEQIRGQPLGPPSDVYALGHIIFELISRKHALAGDHPNPTHFDFQVWHLNAAPAPITQYIPNAPRELVALLSQAMAKNPDHRFATMSAFAASLREVLRIYKLRASVGGTRPMNTPSAEDPIVAALRAPSPDGQWTLSGRARARRAVDHGPVNGTATAVPNTPRDPVSRGMVLGAQGAVPPATERALGSHDSGVRRSPLSGTARLEDTVHPNVLAHLIVVDGAFAGQSFPLEPRTYRIGRDGEVDIYLNDASLSGKHARLVVHPTSIIEVFDEQSTNGTALNGSPVPYAVVKHGDKIRFGRLQCELRLVTPSRASLPPSGTIRIETPTGREVPKTLAVATGAAPPTLAAATPAPPAKAAFSSSMAVTAPDTSSSPPVAAHGVAVVGLPRPPSVPPAMSPVMQRTLREEGAPALPRKHGALYAVIGVLVVLVLALAGVALHQSGLLTRG